MNYLIYISLGVLPSFIWLAYFLRKDVHPESNRMVIKIFLYGMLAALPAALIELGFVDSLFSFLGKTTFSQILYFLIGVAFVEEALKYLVVRNKVLSDPEFDEPIDVMLYMIIAALGFAALENILYLFSLEIREVFLITSFRFVGAIFLHALCSAALGYFLALSFFKTGERLKLFAFGFLIATVLHGLFNFSIMMMEGNIRIIIPGIILIVLALAISLGFKNLKKMASVCKTE